MRYTLTILLIFVVLILHLPVVDCEESQTKTINGKSLLCEVIKHAESIKDYSSKLTYTVKAEVSVFEKKSIELSQFVSYNFILSYKKPKSFRVNWILSKISTASWVSDGQKLWNVSENKKGGEITPHIWVKDYSWIPDEYRLDVVNDVSLEILMRPSNFLSYLLMPYKGITDPVWEVEKKGKNITCIEISTPQQMTDKAIKINLEIDDSIMFLRETKVQWFESGKLCKSQNWRYEDITLNTGLITDDIFAPYSTNTDLPVEELETQGIGIHQFEFDDLPVPLIEKFMNSWWAGRNAPIFILMDRYGRKVSLSDFEGKVVLLYFIDIDQIYFGEGWLYEVFDLKPNDKLDIVCVVLAPERRGWKRIFFPGPENARENVFLCPDCDMKDKDGSMRREHEKWLRESPYLLYSCFRDNVMKDMSARLPGFWQELDMRRSAHTFLRMDYSSDPDKDHLHSAYGGGCTHLPPMYLYSEILPSVFIIDQNRKIRRIYLYDRPGIIQEIKSLIESLFTK